MEDNTPSTDSTRMSDPEIPVVSVTETGRISVNGGAVHGLSPSTTASGNNFSAAPAGRIEANTALLKIGQISPPSVVESVEIQTSSGDETMLPDDEDEGGEAASARIAQEYRRQVRIKRLAEEIQTAEREKKQEEKKRKTELSPRQTNAGKRTATTAKVSDVTPEGMSAPSDSQHAQKRAAAMSAFREVAVRGSGAGTKLAVAAACILFVCVLAGGGYFLYNRTIVDKEKARYAELVAQAKALADQDEKAAQELKRLEAREREVLNQRLAAEEAAKKFEEQKKVYEEQQRVKEAERVKALEAETVRRLADEQRIKEENQKVIDKAIREKEELQRKVEEAQRLARENMKKKQEEDEAKAAAALAEKNKALENTEPVKPDAAKIEVAKPNVTKTEVAKPDAAKTEVAKPDAAKTEVIKPNVTKTEVAKVDLPKPAETVKTTAPITGTVKTIPSEPAAIPDKLELPSGGVRLFVKASDPYGGKLLFHWRQLKGSQVEIVDPSASKFVDGKWVSQTYFVAREPGGYEFEVVVKNDDGVETRKKFPIEVLPPTTLK